MDKAAVAQVITHSCCSLLNVVHCFRCVNISGECCLFTLLITSSASIYRSIRVNGTHLSGCKHDEGSWLARFHLLYCMQTQMFRIEQHSIVTVYEVVSVWTMWWMIFYWCLFVAGEPPVHWVSWSPWCRRGCGAAQLSSCGGFFLKRPLFVLCTVIIGCVVEQMEPHLTPNPHTLGVGWGYF